MRHTMQHTMQQAAQSTKTSASLRWAPAMSAKLLKSLIYEQSLSILVDDYLPAPALEHFQQCFTQAQSQGTSLDGGAPINRLGTPWFTSKHGAAATEKYFTSADEFHRQMHTLCAPFLPPIEQVLRTLDHCWPGGAKLGKIEGRSMCAGLVRDIERGKSLPWHVDADRHGPHGKRGTCLDRANAVLFGNVYIVCDGSSGRLQCKDLRPSPLVYQQLNTLGYGAKALDMPPDVDYLPRPGALVMGHADKWHRVLATEGRRITSSFFVAVFDEEQPLLVYS